MHVLWQCCNKQNTQSSCMYILYIYNIYYIYVLYIYICYHESNVSSRLSPQWLYSNLCYWALEPYFMNRTSCDQVHELLQSPWGDNRRGHSLHDNIYIMPIFVLWDLSTLCGGSLMTTS